MSRMIITSSSRTSTQGQRSPPSEVTTLRYVPGKYSGSKVTTLGGHYAQVCTHVILGVRGHHAQRSLLTGHTCMILRVRGLHPHRSLVMQPQLCTHVILKVRGHYSQVCTQVMLRVRGHHPQRSPLAGIYY